MFNIFANLFDSNEKQLKKHKPLIDKINEYEKEISKLSDEELREKTESFRKAIGYDKEKARKDFSELSKEELKKVLDKEKEELRTILPEAFAVVREASKRISNHRHFDVQLLAGYFLFDNKVVELFTGEGKTLAANTTLYLYGLAGRGAHIVTVNDYLARRDAEWNGHILNSLGITVGAINNNTQFRYISDEEVLKRKGAQGKELIEERKKKAASAGSLKYDHMSGVNLIECTKQEAYACDVVYGTNNEFGFDYLRDNMANSLNDIVQGPLYFAIVDEADSILIDEARTPLIISTSAQASNDMYVKFANLVKLLKPTDHYSVDEKSHAVSLTDSGMDLVEKKLGVSNLYEDSQLAYHLDNALKAKELYKLNDEYIVRDNEVLIVDEFTGRVLPGRRYSEGLHQAIEAKEGVEVKRESRTMATITLQNYFRMYKYRSGMTGTALTEAEEFSKIYNLDVIVVPTNKNVVRVDHSDVVFRTQSGKFKAIVEDIREHNEKGQPVLVGTTSVERSEILSAMLTQEGIPHNVLNAKQHEKEAKIVADAGKKGQVTIATNMAGRGTDISLGEGVKELGGLYIIGSERHESRRIDNQLRGRSGRQGDPGESRFYVSFEDELMRLFGGDKMNMIISSLGVDEDLPISLSLLGRTIESAQKKVEDRNYDIRKNLVEYDDVLNKQREIIYDVRRKILSIFEKHSAQGEIKFDKNKVLAIDPVELSSSLDDFTLTEYSAESMEETIKGYGIPSPILFWLLKKVVTHIKEVVANQLVDDMVMDKVEQRKVFIALKSLFSEDLFEVSTKVMGFETISDFFKKFDTLKDISDKVDMLVKLAYVAFMFHISAIGLKTSVEIAKILTLQTIGDFWMEHLDTMGDLREGINLRNHAQRDPLVEYKNEGYRMFNTMMMSIDDSIVNRFYKIRMAQEEEKKEAIEVKADTKITKKNEMGKVGRNDPCPCGSGKKYKKCHYPQYGS